MRFIPKITDKLIVKLIMMPDDIDDLALLTAMVRSMVNGGKIRCEPYGFPVQWVRFEKIDIKPITKGKRK